MCGIAGYMGAGDKKLLQKMTSVIEYRGRDGEGFYIDSNVGLGHRRLSIIDLDTGAQPIRNEDGTIWIVFNGEIYNFKELRAKLERFGHKFYTQSDTEVIVHAYEQWGVKCAEYLDGIWAFAIWDNRKKAMILGRDEYGVKPLYYCWNKNKLLFGSEIKTILQDDTLERTVDRAAVACYLGYGSVLGEGTMFEGVRRVPAGTLLTCSRGGIDIFKLHRYEPTMYDWNEDLLASVVREAIGNSVESQMVADVPVGAFLSGGIDSTAIVAFASKCTDKPLKTFCVGLGENDDENRWAKAVSDKYGTDHKDLYVSSRDVGDVLKELPWHLDDLISDTAAVPTYFVSKLAAKEVKVVLSGEGSDEAFGGYKRYKPLALPWYVPKFAKIYAFKRMVQIFKSPGKMVDYSYIASMKMLRRTGGLTDYSGLANPDKHFNPYFTGKPLDDGLRWEILEILPNQLLVKVDRMAMANGLETRVPFVSKSMMRLSESINPNLKIMGFESKYILKKALNGIVPNEIIHRKKHGFSIPIQRWFDEELDWICQDGNLGAVELGILKPEIFLSFAQPVKGRGCGFANRKWNLILFELWVRQFLMKG